MTQLVKSFAGRWTLVTGASSGLGAEFAAQIAAAGGNVIITARSKDKLTALAETLAAEHKIEARVVAHDLGAVGGAVGLWRAVTALGVPVEHLISNAGFGMHGPVGGDGFDAERLVELVRLNCESLAVLSSLALPPMIARKSGGIIHLASTASFQPVPFMAAYGASKAFVLSFSNALSEETREHGVRVMALCPGPVPTGFQDVAGTQIAPSQKMATLSAAETVKRGLAAYAAGREVYIPGVVNNLAAASARIAPRRILLRSVANMMRSKKPKAQ